MVRNVTLTAEAALIESARRRAAAEGTSLNALFRTWLTQYIAEPTAVEQYEALMEGLSYVSVGGKHTRDQANTRR